MTSCEAGMLIPGEAATVPMSGFHSVFPDKAQNECRTISPFNDPSLPNRTFLLMELYCTDLGCDCRRVMLNVMDVEAGRHVATINYGFEPPEPPWDVNEGQIFLDPLNPQSAWSAALLALVTEMIESDPSYRARLMRHYAMWKRAVDDPSHPKHTKIVAIRREADRIISPRPERRSEPKVRPNAPCPCGSGRKYKHCCRRRSMERPVPHPRDTES